MYKFKLPIGDWSNDGHGKADWYIIESNKPLQEVRELYFQACEKLGWTLDGHDKKTPCSEYEDNTFPKETLQELLDFGVKLDQNDIDYIFEQEYTDGSELFLKIILEFIKTQDSELVLNIIDDDLKMFQFYGCDNKNRHIGYFGYGLFWN